MAKQDPEWNPNLVGDYDRIAELHSEAVTPMFPEMAGVLALIEEFLVGCRKEQAPHSY